MVTSTHEASHRIFQERPEILTPVFGILDLPVPAKANIEVITPDVTETRPLERRIDSLLRIEPSEGQAFLLAIEAQRSRDRKKEKSWAYYLAHLQSKYDIPAILLVVCQDRATATWAAGPFTYGLGDWTAQCTHPLVLGPANVPVITDPSVAARNLAMATFSAMTHGKSRDLPDIPDALARALRATDPESARYYSELLYVGLGDAQSRETWREKLAVITYFPGRGSPFEVSYLEGKAKGEAEGRAKGEAEGRAEGEAKSVLRLLERRGIAVPDDARERILGCTDLDTLRMWFDRAYDLTHIGELFADGPAER
jgi:hypothetical protein